MVHGTPEQKQRHLRGFLTAKGLVPGLPRTGRRFRPGVAAHPRRGGDDHFIVNGQKVGRRCALRGLVHAAGAHRPASPKHRGASPGRYENSGVTVKPCGR
jgi:alkylation response protein AidB-like acyl-CoA dehydrogenase